MTVLISPTNLSSLWFWQRHHDAASEEITLTTLVRHLLLHKPDVHTVGPDDTVLTALRLMAEKNIGAVLVVNGATLEGIFSERDYARKVVLHGKASQETTVREIMTAPVISIPADWSVSQCMALMTERHIRHLPVMENDALIGVISIGDVVGAFVGDQQFTISTLESYIMSGG